MKQCTASSTLYAWIIFAIYSNFGLFSSLYQPLRLCVESGERSLKATNNSLLQINCSLLFHTHTQHTHKSERYKKQCSGPNPISTSRFITQAGGAKKLSQEDRASGGGSIFQYSPVCSTGPRRYPTSSWRTQGRQMTAVSGTREGKARGPGGGLPEPLCQRRHLYVETVTGPETDGSNRTRHRKDRGGEKK